MNYRDEANIDAMNDVDAAHKAYVTPCCGTKPEFDTLDNTYSGLPEHVVICECGEDVTADYADSVY